MKVIINEPAPNKVLISTNNNQVKVIENIIQQNVNIPSVNNNAGNIAQSILVTNTIGDAITGNTYNAGTSVEAIIRDIISPYWEPTVDSLIIGADNQSGVTKVALGTAPTITGAIVVVSNSSNMISTSGNQYSVTVRNQENQIIGTINKPGTVTSNTYFASIVTGSAITATTVETPQTYSATVSYRNEANTQTLTHTKQITIESRKKCMLIASSDFSISNLQDFLDDATIMATSLESKDSLSDEIEVLLNCTSAASDPNNYVYLLIPASKSLKEAASTTSGVGVANITYSWTLVTDPISTWSYTEGIATYPVKLYRSTQTGPYNENILLDFTII
jgi:hypothetical protein